MQTDLFIAATIASVIGFDIWLAATKRITISERMAKHGQAVKAMPFLWGVLAGHFWGGDLVPHTLPLWASLPAVLALGGGAWFAGRYINSGKLQLVWAALGAAAGTLLWPQ